MRILILFFLLLSFEISFSQEVKFLEENTLESVKFAPVLVGTTKQWFLTDSNGVISFSKLSLPFEIHIKALGYEDKMVAISSNTTIYLKRTYQVLNDVVVKPKVTQSKKFETKNGKIFHGYTFNWKGSFKGFGTIINFKDSINWLNKVIFSAKIEGDRKSKLVRFRLYKFTKDFNNIDNSKPFNKGYEEIYNYELKNVFNDPDYKWVTFNLPPNIVLESGNYLISFELMPNNKDKLAVWYSNDHFIHSYYTSVKNYWVVEWFTSRERFYNMKVKVDYDTY